MRRLILLLPLLAACAPVPVGVAQQAIVGGTTDNGDPGVVLVIAQKGAQGSLCTGEVVSPHVVLTAAHCVAPAIVGTGVTFRVYTGNDFNQNVAGDYKKVSETHFHQMFNQQNPFGGYDIAVVITTDALDITPLAMNRTAITDAMVGSAVRLVGYGVTSAADVSTGATAGIKRQTSTTLAAYDDLKLMFDGPSHLTCEGDSGGPAFMKVDGQNEVIVGTTSYGDQNCMIQGVDTRVDDFADSFVQPFIDMLDPKPMPSSSPGDTAQPGEIGGACKVNGDCTSGLCTSTGYCTMTCDPKNDACTGPTHCGQIQGQNYCVRNERAGGCSTVPGARSSEVTEGLLVALALLSLLLLRRRRA